MGSPINCEIPEPGDYELWISAFPGPKTGPGHSYEISRGNTHFISAQKCSTFQGLLRMGGVGSRPQGRKHSEKHELRAPEGRQPQVGTKQARCTEAGRPVPVTSDKTYQGAGIPVTSSDTCFGLCICGTDASISPLCLKTPRGLFLLLVCGLGLVSTVLPPPGSALPFPPVFILCLQWHSGQLLALKRNLFIALKNKPRHVLFLMGF